LIDFEIHLLAHFADNLRYNCPKQFHLAQNASLHYLVEYKLKKNTNRSTATAHELKKMWSC